MKLSPILAGIFWSFVAGSLVHAQSAAPAGATAAMARQAPSPSAATTPTPAVSPSADPVPSAKLELADRVLVLTHFDQETAAAYYDAAVMLSALQLTPAQRTSLKHTLQAMKLFDWKAARPRFDTVEANAYTEEELQSMADFFSGPVGRKWINQRHSLDPEMREQFTAMMKADRERINDGILEARESAQ